MTERLWRLSNAGNFESYRVTRRTPGRVYFMTLGGERYVARRALERDGFVRSTVLGAFMYSDAGYRRFAVRTAPRSELAALGLSASATIDDVRRAYRERAKTAHPDTGGTVEAFIALRKNYERALEAVEPPQGS